MAELRRVVPDNSVLIEALFPEHGGLLSKRGQQFLTAVLNRSVVCFAPDLLMVEFMKIAFEFRSGRRQHSLSLAEVDAQLELFLTMKINYERSSDLARLALTHSRDSQISPPDSWYLAAAEINQAELWISHWHADGFTKNAAAVYDNVFTLEDDDFYTAARKRGG